MKTVKKKFTSPEIEIFSVKFEEGFADSGNWYNSEQPADGGQFNWSYGSNDETWG